MPKFHIGNRWVGDAEPTYFIADIGANHDGKFERAKLLIRLAKEAGADGAKATQNARPAIGFGQTSFHRSPWINAMAVRCHETRLR